MSDLIGLFSQFTTVITSLSPEVLTILFAIVLGYIAKAIPPFKNSWIPILVLLSGPVLYPQLSARADQVQITDPLLSQIIKGTLLSAGAWALHKGFLRDTLDALVRKYLPQPKPPKRKSGKINVTLIPRGRGKPMSP